MDPLEINLGTKVNALLNTRMILLPTLLISFFFFNFYHCF